MAIFNSYVSLPKGNSGGVSTGIHGGDMNQQTFYGKGGVNSMNNGPFIDYS